MPAARSSVEASTAGSRALRCGSGARVFVYQCCVEDAGCYLSATWEGARGRGIRMTGVSGGIIQVSFQ